MRFPIYLLELCKTRSLMLNKDKIARIVYQGNNVSPEHFYKFPLSEGKMYGGALMENSVSQILNGSKIDELKKFTTFFYHPTSNKSVGEKFITKDGPNIKWTEFRNIEEWMSGKRLTAVTFALFDKSEPTAVDNENSLISNPKVEVKENLDLMPFNDYMKEFFKSIDANFDLNNGTYRQSNGLLDFLDFLTESFDLKIQRTSHLKMFYSISEKCPEDEIHSCLIYLIDILMVCYAAIPSNQPIHNSQKIVYSSLEHQMNFVQTVKNSLMRKGMIEFSISSCPNANSSHFVDAKIFNEDKINFCRASQIVFLAQRRNPKTKSQL